MSVFAIAVSPTATQRSSRSPTPSPESRHEEVAKSRGVRPRSPAQASHHGTESGSVTLSIRQKEDPSHDSSQQDQKKQQQQQLQAAQASQTAAAQQPQPAWEAAGDAKPAPWKVASRGPKTELKDVLAATAAESPFPSDTIPESRRACRRRRRSLRAPVLPADRRGAQRTPTGAGLLQLYECAPFDVVLGRNLT